MKLMGTITAILVLLATLALAQSQSQQPQPPDPTAQAPTTKAPPPKQSTVPQTQEQQGQTYIGEVILMNGTYYLRSGADQYMIQDQAKGKQYAGQTVRVKGSLDSQNTLHIQSIATHQ
jgi:uncharacterized protein YdeI (BOF family)